VNVKVAIFMDELIVSIVFTSDERYFCGHIPKWLMLGYDIFFVLQSFALEIIALVQEREG